LADLPLKAIPVIISPDREVLKCGDLWLMCGEIIDSASVLFTLSGMRSGTIAALGDLREPAVAMVVVQ
jgi:hypothetical protein